MGKVIKITEDQLKNLIDKQINEQESNPKEDGTYMVLSNLMMIKEYVDTILKYKHQADFSNLVTGEHAWAGDHIATSKDDIQEVANFIETHFNKEEMNEEKMKGKNPCWKGFEMVGKKMKNGKEVPNCVPKKKNINEQLEEITTDDLETLKKINNSVNRQEVIQWFNNNDVDYFNMTDIEMYIHYIEKNMEDIDNEEDLGSVEETNYIPDDMLNEAEYQGRKVKLGKIMQGDVKKFKVYVKNDKGKVVKVNFGFGGKSAKGKRMTIKKNNPERRKSFRARHNCDNPGPRWKARYWACKTW